VRAEEADRDQSALAEDSDLAEGAAELPLDDEEAEVSEGAVLDCPSPDEDVVDVADLAGAVSASLAFFLDSDG
jgi:hypothetical protein